MGYWLECISEAFDDAKITATKDQIKIVSEVVQGGSENYGLYKSADCIPNPLEAEIKELKAQHKEDMQEAHEREIELERDLREIVSGYNCNC